jgi:hypothetical protein
MTMFGFSAAIAGRINSDKQIANASFRNPKRIVGKC